MNLYRIDSEHYSPKDCHESIICYLLAEDEDELYYDDDTGEEDLTHREWVKQNGGELSQDQFLNDLYYGVTLIGYELMEQNIDMESEFIQKLISLEIAIDSRKLK